MDSNEIFEHDDGTPIMVNRADAIDEYAAHGLTEADLDSLCGRSGWYRADVILHTIGY